MGLPQGTILVSTVVTKSDSNSQTEEQESEPVPGGKGVKTHTHTHSAILTHNLADHLLRRRTGHYLDSVVRG